MDRRTGRPIDAEDWLPGGTSSPRDKRQRLSQRRDPELEEWLPADMPRRPARSATLVALPGVGPAGKGEARPPQPQPSDESPIETTTPPEPESGDLSALTQKLAGLEAVVADQADRLKGQQEVIARLRAGQIEAGLQPEPEAQWSAIGSFDPNAVSAEELLRIGLSRTQAARFLSRRDDLGGFRSVEQFDLLRGFPAALRERLKAGARISA
jgi:DNA uptake protein ComE-like DNA-binding protein